MDQQAPAGVQMVYGSLGRMSALLSWEMVVAGPFPASCPKWESAGWARKRRGAQGLGEGKGLVPEVTGEAGILH